MIIIGCDYHPAFQQIAFVDTDTGELQERRLHTVRKGRGSTAISRPRELRCAWAWRPVDMRAGSSDCWRN
jgi:hypothetical protein